MPVYHSISIWIQSFLYYQGLIYITVRWDNLNGESILKRWREIAGVVFLRNNQYKIETKSKKQENN